jgi:NTE family protein
VADVGHPERVALVLAGGGARGAYEMGALAELLPALSAAEQPRIVVGTSVGAINAAYVAATANEPLEKRIEQGERLWRDLEYDQILEPLLSASEALRFGRYAGAFLGVPGARLDSLLNPAPLSRTLPELVPFDQLGRNVDDGTMEAAAVVATSGLTNLSVVFHDGAASPGRDVARGIEYVRTKLAPEHVLASAAIPTIFPPVEVDGAWYFDGGTRLNTPIKPAIALGAERVVVIALNSLVRRTGGFTKDHKPDALDGAGQLIQGLLVDPLVNDVGTLALINELVADGDRAGRRLIPYMLIAPDDPDEIGALASEIYRERYAGLTDAFNSQALLGRIVDAGSSVTHGELFSYVFFAREFAEKLIELGRRDARAWLDAEHDDGVWQLARLF